MSTKWVIGNWKMNPADPTEAAALAQSLLHTVQAADISCQVGVAPSFLHLVSVRNILKEWVHVGAQDIAAHQTPVGIGAFTGDVSAVQLMNVGLDFVLVGHSERRQYYNETANTLAAKIRQTFASGLSVIYCVGESKASYECQETLDVLTEQLAVLADIVKNEPSTSPKNLPQLFIAYEPVWAIGTGLTPTLDEIEQVHGFIRQTIQKFGMNAPILYGGSVNDTNAAEFARSTMIDGALVGGASLKIESFAKIISAFSE